MALARIALSFKESFGFWIFPGLKKLKTLDYYKDKN
jgi:hypothetical protein